MPHDQAPALTPEQWEAGDYRQAARDLDGWAKSQPEAAGDDATEYVAKLGLNKRGLGGGDEPGARPCAGPATREGAAGGLRAGRAAVWFYGRRCRSSSGRCRAE